MVDYRWEVEKRHRSMTPDEQAAYYKGLKLKCEEIIEKYGHKDSVLKQYLEEVIRAVDFILPDVDKSTHYGHCGNWETGLYFLQEAEAKLWPYLEERAKQ